MGDILPCWCRPGLARCLLRHINEFDAEGINHICMGIFKGYPSDTSPSLMRSYGGAGAVWDIWPRECRPAIERFLVRHAAQFRIECASGDDGENKCEDEKKGETDILHPIHDQASKLLLASKCLAVTGRCGLPRIPGPPFCTCWKAAEVEHGQLAASGDTPVRYDL